MPFPVDVVAPSTAMTLAVIDKGSMYPGMGFGRSCVSSRACLKD